MTGSKSGVRAIISKVRSPLPAILVLCALSAVSEPPSTPSTHAWKLLEDGLTQKALATRMAAVHALGLLPNMPRAESLAEKALNDSEKDVRAEAAGALGRMGAQVARPKLRIALHDKEVKVVIASANALYQLKDPAAYQVYYALLTGNQKANSGLIHTQMDTLKDRKQVEKMALEAGIGFVPFGGIGYEAWKTITRDDVSSVRAAAATGLASDPDPKSGAALVDSCSDKKWQVRTAVVEAIARRGDPTLLGPVEALIGDENITVRFDAAAAVVHLSSLQRTPPTVPNKRAVPLGK